MSLVKTLLGLTVVVGICIAVFILMRDRGISIPLQQSLQVSNPAVGTPSGSSAADSVPPTPVSVAMALANDPRRTAPTIALADTNKLDPATAKRYQDALDALELDGCNSNGTLAVRVRGDRLPRMVRSGQPLQMKDGFSVTLRAHGYPACRVTLYDGKTAIGDVSGF